MIDLSRLKAVGTGLAFGYAIVKDCDKRFQAHCPSLTVGVYDFDGAGLF